MAEMEHTKSSDDFLDTPKNSELPEAQPPSPKILAQEGGHFSAHPLDSPAIIEAPLINKLQHETKGEKTITVSRQEVSSVSSTEKKTTSDDSELGSRLECLGSNIVAIPLPDVSDPAFDVRQWATQVLHAADADKVRFRKASFVFKGLDVSGSVAGASVQPTVASTIMAPIALARHLLGRKPPQRKILSSFDGVVNSGEMLLVLGRPGSGCSTLLRTIAGELGGIKVGTQSIINYNGMIHHVCAPGQH
jgi:ABC-type multidrug transport system fused ATPase/permease subunit